MHPHRVRRARRLQLLSGFFLATVLLVPARGQDVTPIFTSISAPRQVVNLGESLTLNVTATGNPAPTYQWKQNGQSIAGATTSSYTITSASGRDNGSYEVVATNSIGTTTSAVVFVNVVVNSAEVLAWGDNTYGQTTVPSGLTDVVSVVAGSFYNLVLKGDGTVVAWGSNDSGRTTVPADLTGVVVVAAGYAHSLALKSDGTVVAWGNNSAGQTAVPTGLTNVVGIAAGGGYSMALKSDGTVVAWGSSLDPATTVPWDLTNVVGIAAGGGYSMALKADGTVTMWGANLYDERAVPAGLANVIGITAGGNHSLALKSDGNVVAWGDNSVGQSTVPANHANVVGLAAGVRHSVALRGPTVVVTAPAITVQPVTQTIRVGQSVTFSVTATGTAPLRYQWRKNSASISGATNATLTFAIVQTSDAGRFDVVIRNIAGTVTSGSATLTVNPSVITAISAPRQVAALGQSLTLNVTVASGAVAAHQWKHNGRTIGGATAASYTIASAAVRDNGWYQDVVTDSSGETTSAVIFVSVAIHTAQILAWGSNNANGEISVPAGLTDVISVAVGAAHNLALKSDGTVVAWGATVTNKRRCPQAWQMSSA